MGDIEKLMAAVIEKSTKPATDEEMYARALRIQEAEKIFAANAKSQEITDDLLNKRVTI